MPRGFQQISDWFSWENQGGNVAVADLSGNGHQDLLVLMVDNPSGQNRGLYRVGRRLDTDGDVTGDWTDWIEVPDWFSSENQGAGIAVGDVDEDGRPDLVVFMIDNPPGQNQGYYRLGKALDANGKVTGGWTAWMPIPDWFPWENQHGAITLTDLDSDGRLELIVLMVDNPPGQNRGVYRVGRKLDANGNVIGGWTAWENVPDWFSWENQGVGVAVVDLDGVGNKDLLVFQIDGAVEQNQAFYKVGKNIAGDGKPASGWSLWRGVPGWFAWENQGGGIAAMKRNGKPGIVVMMIDNPPGQNAGLRGLEAARHVLAVPISGAWPKRSSQAWCGTRRRFRRTTSLIRRLYWESIIVHLISSAVAIPFYRTGDFSRLEGRSPTTRFVGGRTPLFSILNWSNGRLLQAWRTVGGIQL